LKKRYVEKYFPSSTEKFGGLESKITENVRSGGWREKRTACKLKLGNTWRKGTDRVKDKGTRMLKVEKSDELAKRSLSPSS